MKKEKKGPNNVVWSRIKCESPINKATFIIITIFSWHVICVCWYRLGRRCWCTCRWQCRPVTTNSSGRWGRHFRLWHKRWCYRLCLRNLHSSPSWSRSYICRCYRLCLWNRYPSCFCTWWSIRICGGRWRHCFHPCRGRTCSHGLGWRNRSLSSCYYRWSCCCCGKNRKKYELQTNNTPRKQTNKHIMTTPVSLHISRLQGNNSWLEKIW